MLVLSHDTALLYWREIASMDEAPGNPVRLRKKPFARCFSDIAELQPPWTEWHDQPVDVLVPAVAHPVKATTESMAATTTAAIFLLIPIALTPYQFPFLGFQSDEAIMTRQP